MTKIAQNFWLKDLNPSTGTDKVLSIDGNGEVKQSTKTLDQIGVVSGLQDVLAEDNTAVTEGNWEFGSNRTRITSNNGVYVQDTNLQSNLKKNGVLFRDLSSNKSIEINFAGSTGTHAQVLQDKGGTIALLSDVPSTSNLIPYSGATSNVDLGIRSLTGNAIISSSSFPELRLFNSGTNNEFRILENASPNSFVTSLVLPASSGTLATTNDIPSYAEGTFTPTLTDTGGGATYTGTMQGEYIRTGNLVNFNISLSALSTSGTPTGFLQISNLPFVVDNLSLTSSACAINQLQGVNVNYYSAVGSVIESLDSIRIGITTSDSSEIVTLSSATFTSGIIVISGTYKTNVYTP